MGNVIRAKDFGGFFGLIEGINVLDGEDGQCLVVAGIEKSETDARFQTEGVNLFLRDIKSDGYWEQRAVCESQVFDDTTEKLEIRQRQLSVNANLS